VSLGVSLYVLLTGELPFYAKDRFELFQQIERGAYAFPPHLWVGISESAKNLVRRLLDINPKTRITADQAMQHEWIVVSSLPVFATCSTASTSSSSTSASSSSAAPTVVTSKSTVGRKRSSAMMLCDSTFGDDKENQDGQPRQKKRRPNSNKPKTTSMIL